MLVPDGNRSQSNYVLTTLQCASFRIRMFPFLCSHVHAWLLHLIMREPIRVSRLYSAFNSSHRQGPGVRRGRLIQFRVIKTAAAVRLIIILIGSPFLPPMTTIGQTYNQLMVWIVINMFFNGIF